MTGREKLGAVLLAVVGMGIALLAGAPRPAREPAFAAVGIELPEDEAVAMPAGPHLALFTQRCTACHSAAMITRQPPLTPEQWAATVKKMREAYKAPVADAEVAPILDQLAAISAAHLSGS